VIQVARRPPGLISSSLPLSHKVSLTKEGSAREVVVDRRWSWSRVTERDELVGKISLVSRLPQYLRIGCYDLICMDATSTHLMTAMLTGAEAVA
jgi:hypothetical protein